MSDDNMNGVTVAAPAPEPEVKLAEPAAKAAEPESSTANGNEELPELTKKIVQQVEFYFGDINLPRDRFLQDEVKKDEGWVALEVMVKFNRLAQLSSDLEVLAEALQHSKLLEVSEDKTKIRRDPEMTLPENSLEYWQAIKHRTVYMKGFKPDAKLDEIQEIVQKFGETENVMMRRDKGGERRFKGSVFVTFKTREMCENLVNADVKFQDNELTKMMQEDYWASKQQQMKDRKAADRNAKQAKKAADADEKETVKATAHFVKGMVLSVEGIPKEGVGLMQIKDFFRKFGDVAYVVHEAGSEKAQIRFSGEEDCARKAWADAVEKGEEGKVMMEVSELKANVLEGEEEEKYWDEFNKNKANKIARGDSNKRGRGGRGRGGRGGRGRGGRGGRGGFARADHHDSGMKREANAGGDGGSETKKPKKTVFGEE